MTDILLCQCGKRMRLESLENPFWKPTYNDPDSGGDPVYSYVCECGKRSPLRGDPTSAKQAALEYIYPSDCIQLTSLSKDPRRG